MEKSFFVKLKILIWKNSNNIPSVSKKLQLIDETQNLPKVFVNVRKKLKRAYGRNCK